MNKVLIACEESQAITIAFRNVGFEAYSCDLQECSGGYPEWHIHGDALSEAYSGKYILMIGHPPCTYLSGAGNGYFNVKRFGEKAIERWQKRVYALDFFYKMYQAPIPYICLENPVGFLSSCSLQADQIIEPWYFGDEHKKRTGLWLKNLPLLTYSRSDSLFYSQTASDEPQPIYVDKSGKARYLTEAISGSLNNTSLKRSKTFPGIANAMADQWGG